MGAMNGHVPVAGGVLRRLAGESDAALGARADAARRTARDVTRRAKDAEARRSGDHIERFLRCFGDGS